MTQWVNACSTEDIENEGVIRFDYGQILPNLRRAWMLL